MKALLAAALLVSAAAPAAVVMTVPTDLSAADPAAVRVTGLPPGARVELGSERPAGYPRKLTVAHATFVADRAGTVDLGRLAPVAGDYHGVDKAGLFWAAAPARALGPGDPGPGELRVTATADGHMVATATTRVGPAADAVTTETIAQFPGSVLVRPRAVTTRLPLVIVLGGSEGGSYTAKEISPLLAARGYAVLGLPYYSPGYDPSDRISGLPTSFINIPVDRLTEVEAWARARADVDANHIGLWGVSKGGEFAMVAASRYPWLKAVVGVVPSDVVWEGWGQDGPKTASFAFEGKPLPFLHYVGMDEAFARMAKGERVPLRGPHADGRKAYPAELAAARIPIERYRGALLLIAGEQDQVWPSADMVRAIVAARTRAGLTTEVVIGADAGHALGDPAYLPAVEAAAGLGGTPLGVAHTRGLGWSKTIALFDGTLKR